MLLNLLKNQNSFLQFQRILEVGAEIYKNILTTVLVQTDHGFGSALVDNLGHINKLSRCSKTLINPIYLIPQLTYCFAQPGDDINEQYVYEADVVKVDPSKDLALIKLRTLSPLVESYSKNY